MMVKVQEISTKVLYVDDDAIDQKAFQRFIKNGEYFLQYDLASSIEEAEILLNHNGYDVVVTDYLLDHKTGFSILNQIKTIPVIFITGQGDQQIAVKAIKEGAFDYIVKESTGAYIGQLVATVKKAAAYNAEKKRLKIAQTEIKHLLWALSHINNAIMILDKDATIEWVNKGFENLFGYTMDEIRNKHVRTFRGNDLTEKKLQKIFSYTFKQKTTLTCESKIMNRSGKQSWVYTTITPVVDGNNVVNRVIIVDTDISEKKKIEQQLIKSKERAEAAAVTKQQFIANMSHEIRTPINAIMGMMHMLENTEDAATRKKYLQLVNSASNNLLNIINDILDISKLEVGKIPIEKVDFNVIDLVLNIKKSMQYRAQEKGLELNCIIENGVPEQLHGDQARLNQILINLVGNAIKFTPKGKITISVKAISKTKTNVKLLFTVSDTGIGIAQSSQVNIFQYFHQVHSDATRQYGGTGLGLAIVKRLAESQKGKVWFTSKENKGSDFYVELSFEICKTNKAKEIRSPVSIEDFFLKGKSILLVEDEALNQMVAKYLLENDLGAFVQVAENGKIAMNMFKKTNFDLIIMDIQMPVMDGYTTAKYIREKLSEPKRSIPILAMTAHAFKEEEIKCKEAGMDGFVSKPFKTDELKQKLSSIMSLKNM